MTKYQIKRFMLDRIGYLDKQWRRLAPGLYAFNYHRIGNPDETEFDPNVFSCDSQHFRTQLELIKSRFRIIGVQELLELVASNEPPSEALALITFDDGYADNHRNALPILLELQSQALFFLPTDFIESEKIPWWDEAAWLVRKSKHSTIRLPGLNEVIDRDRNGVAESIRSVLRYFKNNTQYSIVEKLALLEIACELSLDPSVTPSLFLSWKQVGEMLERGMGIGSHTCSHRILSHISAYEQQSELTRSKLTIEKHTGCSVSTLAYPVGGLDSYTEETRRLAGEAGYLAAFNFIKGGGYNTNPSSNKFDLVRIPVHFQASAADIKLTVIGVPPRN